MSQKIINPFALKPKEIYPGIIIRRDEVLVTDVTFNFNFSILYSYYISQISSKISSYSFQEIRKLKSLCGIHNSVGVDDSAKAITKIICNDMFGIINVLTEKNTSYSLSEYIMADIVELPKLLLSIIQFINSHKVADYIEGSGDSIVKWRNIEKIFDSSELHDNPEKYNAVEILLKTRRITEIFKELGFEEIVKLDNISAVFYKSQFVLNGSVSLQGENSLMFKMGDNFDKEDLLMYILCQPQYTFSDDSFSQYDTITLDKLQVQQILRMPVSMMCDSNINFTSNERLVNTYIESHNSTLSNMKLSFSPLASKNLPSNVRRNVKSLVKNIKDNVTKDLISKPIKGVVDNENS